MIYLNGEYLEEKEAKISLLDRALLCGDGVFVTLQIKEGVPLFLERHIQKLHEQASALFMAPPTIKEEEVEKLIALNGAQTGVWRLKIFYTGGEEAAMRLPKGRRGSLFMVMKPYSVPPYQPLRLTLYPEPIRAAQARFKSISHLGRYMIMEYALQNGFDDAITTTEGGELLETAFGNLFWIEKGEFFTPDFALPLHIGVTISVLKERLSVDYKHHAARVTLEEIPSTASLYRCNTMGGIRPIHSIQNKPFRRDLLLEEKLHKVYALLPSLSVTSL